jgi:sec-independent protein translocase protein TatA
MHTTLAIFGMGGGEILFVMAAALVLFGANKIPQFAKGLGQAIKEFKKASSDVSNEIHSAINQETPTTPPPAKPQTAPESTAPVATVPKS